MSIDRNSPNLGFLLVLSGFLCVAFGFLAFSQRFALADTFLGADFFLGMPLTKGDSHKVLFVGMQSLGAIVGGLMMLISGVVIAIVNASRMGSSAEKTGAAAPARPAH